MKLYYIWDAYCGWCYGFKGILKDFMAKHPELKLEIISGGLFDQGNPMSAYPHIPEVNQQISQIFRVEFGKAYEKVLLDGSLVMNSYHAAVGFGLLKNALSQDRWLDLADALQTAFYKDGLSLSDVATYHRLAEQFGVASFELYQAIALALKEETGQHPDFQLARNFGVRGYPTLLLEKNGNIYDLRGDTVTVKELENNFNML